MPIEYHTPDGCICNPHMGMHGFVLLIERLQLINKPPVFKSYRLLHAIRHLFSAAAIFTHAIDQSYLFLRARSGISLEESLQYAALSYSVSMHEALKQGCDMHRRNYLAAPVRNTDGHVVAVTTILRESESNWRPEEVDAFRLALSFIEHHVVEHDEM
ncbi:MULTISPECIES: GAF domain-containing protein [Methylobacillus]|uniref:GAF domain-containing protein n=1 Tax=Methylobacillus TaxID=404 RepID=UPI0018A140AE|nr:MULTISPECIES: GAF domain-containing protein [Methylobacillus]